MSEYFIVTRKHEIHAGHRVCNHEGACKNLHGHSYIFNFYCRSYQLDNLGRVIDFSVLKTTLCSWLDDNWDHRLILWEKDPWFKALSELDPNVITIPYNPTAENLAKYLVMDVGPRVLTNTGVELFKVEVCETSKCSASYELSS